MRTAYQDLDISFAVENTTFRALNIAFEKFIRPIPRHSHGSNSYELHFIPYGRGKVNIDRQIFDITPNTFYMTGPHVEHEQIPIEQDPMAEYCIYFQIEKSSGGEVSNVENISQKFQKTTFWFGQDQQDFFSLMQQLFFELEHSYTGYTLQVEALLKQAIVKAVRNYESKRLSKLGFLPSNLGNSKYIIVEECFLYEFETITLEGLANRLGLGQRQTERVLKEYYGKTFLQKKAEAKMSMAKLYLKDKNMNISEIANLLNYSSVQHFSYAFRQYYGVSATTYRKQELI